MSIIHDALKKAQNKIKATEQPEEKNIYKKLQQKKSLYTSSDDTPNTELKSDDIDLTVSTIEKKKKWNITFISLIAIFSLFIGAFISLLAVLINQSQVLNGDGRNNTTAGGSAKPSKSYKPGELELSGTMMMGDKQVALINGEIYELGEIVKGYQITSITLKNIELMKDGKLTQLDVRKER